MRVRKSHENNARKKYLNWIIVDNTFCIILVIKRIYMLRNLQLNEPSNIALTMCSLNFTMWPKNHMSATVSLLNEIMTITECVIFFQEFIAFLSI